jgi:Putative oxidoreductase C terminal domain
VDIMSVQAHSLEWYENAGQLSKLTIDESKILPENRIPRVTAATWYDNLFLLSGRILTLSRNY